MCAEGRLFCNRVERKTDKERVGKIRSKLSFVLRMVKESEEVSEKLAEETADTVIILAHASEGKCSILCQKREKEREFGFV